MNKLPQGEKFVIADPLYHLLPDDRKKTAFLNVFAADMAKQAVELDKIQRAMKFVSFSGFGQNHEERKK